MAIDGFAVNGAALVYVGTGAAGALELLGYTDSGVDMDVQELTADIMSDVFGQAPHDVQYMGKTARIVANLIAMDRTILAKITGRGDRTTVGQLNTAGMVIGAAGYAFRLGISAPLDTPWSFSKAIVRGGFSTRLASKANPFRVEFFAGPFGSTTATTSKDVPLWTRSLS